MEILMVQAKLPLIVCLVKNVFLFTHTLILENTSWLRRVVAVVAVIKIQVIVTLGLG